MGLGGKLRNWSLAVLSLAAVAACNPQSTTPIRSTPTPAAVAGAGQVYVGIDNIVLASFRPTPGPAIYNPAQGTATYNLVLQNTSELNPKVYYRVVDQQETVLIDWQPVDADGYLQSGEVRQISVTLQNINPNITNSLWQVRYEFTNISGISNVPSGATVIDRGTGVLYQVPGGTPVSAQLSNATSTPIQSTPFPALAPTSTPAPIQSTPFPALTPTSTPAPIQSTPFPALTPTSTPAPQPSATPVLSPTATPSPAQTPVPTRSPNPESLADLSPYAFTQFGWQAPIVIGDKKLVNAATDGTYVGVGIANSGRTGAGSFSAELFVDGHKAYTWNVEPLQNGQATIRHVPVIDVIRNVWEQHGVYLRSGEHSLEVRIDSGNNVRESSEDNNTRSLQQTYSVAKAPVPRREPQSEVEAKIQKMFDEYTWLTKENESGLLAIAKDVLRDVPIDWSKVKLEILPYEEFNARYTATFNSRPSESNKHVGLGFLTGTTAAQEIYLREGTVPALLPVLIRELGGARYAQSNNSGMLKIADINPKQGAKELFQGIFEQYGVSVLNEQYGWEGLTNVSYIANRSRINSFMFAVNNPASSSPGMEIRSVWSIEAAAGYGPGEAPAAFWLGYFNQYTGLPNPVARTHEIGAAAMKYDPGRIQTALNGRFVDAPPVALPSELKETLNVTYLDDVVLAQNTFAYPN